jgi:hypothetical protein
MMSGISAVLPVTIQRRRTRLRFDQIVKLAFRWTPSECSRGAHGGKIGVTFAEVVRL